LRLIRVTSESGASIYIDAEKIIEILAGKDARDRIGTYVTIEGATRSRWVHEDLETVKKLIEKEAPK